LRQRRGRATPEYLVTGAEPTKQRSGVTATGTDMDGVTDVFGVSVLVAAHLGDVRSSADMSTPFPIVEVEGGGLGATRFVAFHAGDFCGKDTVRRAAEQGTERRLVGFEMTERGAVPRGHAHRTRTEHTPGTEARGRRDGCLDHLAGRRPGTVADRRHPYDVADVAGPEELVPPRLRPAPHRHHDGVQADTVPPSGVGDAVVAHGQVGEVGYLNLGVGGDGQWHKLCDVLGLTDLGHQVLTAETGEDGQGA
jgi:hypothetical protein